jgi:phospholipid/cholesterol/gamma-HCH transport system permease protein
MRPSKLGKRVHHHSPGLNTLGGAVAAMFALDITMTQFAKQLQVAVSIDHFWVGIVKAPVMAMVIAMIGCFQGLKVSSNAESVGRRTTQSVVQGVFFVIAIDAVFSIFFLIIGV